MRRGVPAAFLDMAWTVVCVLFALVLISVVQKKTPPAPGQVTPKAEFLVQLDWDDNSPHDVDLYVRGPDGKLVFFLRRDAGYMFLDRDNVGRNNSVSLPDGGEAQIPSRREIVTIRSIVPGDYIVNAHVYAEHGTTHLPIHARLTVTKLNPYRLVTQVERVLTEVGEEQTLTNFTVGRSGEVTVFYAPERLTKS